MLEYWINNKVNNVLLVEPDFPIPNKSRNHSNFLPIGLLKIASYLREKKINIKLIRFKNNEKNNIKNFNPDLICVTSIFTYWSSYVKDTVQYYKKNYPKVPVIVGGIYASLMPKHCKSYTGCDDVIIGQIPEAEKLIPSYDLIDVDYQIIHTSRGCIRKCGFCGVYDVEPKWCCKKSIKNEIIKKNLIFYDNNLLANPYIKNILKELIELKKQRKINYLESQSGFDGRIILKNPEIGVMLKKAGFKNPKIAWDGGLNESNSIYKQIQILINAGYKAKEISVFMIYNYELPYSIMEIKRIYCFNWGVQITDCRYRPLNATFDNYNPRKINGQTNKDYYIHYIWSDSKIREYRRNIRRHNICIRHDVDYHSKTIERKKLPSNLQHLFFKKNYNQIKKILKDAWSPSYYHISKKSE